MMKNQTAGPVDRIRPYLKAVAAFVLPGVVLLPAAALPPSDGGRTITTYEILLALAACITTAAGVYRTKNRPRRR